MIRIQDVTVFALKVPGPEPYLGKLRASGVGAGESGYVVREPWRSLYSAQFETMLVRLRAQDGTTGWGEALAPVAPEVPAEVIRRMLADQLIGQDAEAPRVVTARLRELMRERGHLVGHQADALAAIDIALWDLAGRLAGRSVATMLGGAFRDSVATYVSGLPGETPDRRADLARDWQARGAAAVKLHLGKGVDDDLATIDALQDAVPQLRVAVDAHWAYRLPEARRLGRELERRGALFLEAPLAPESLEDHRDLAAGLGIPVAIGETLRNRFEFRQWLGARAVGLAQPDVARTGITEGWSIAELCQTHAVPVALHHSVGLGVALAAGLQLSAAIEDCAYFEFQPTTTEVANGLLKEPLVGGPGQFKVPSGPGLGVDIDEDLVSELATEGSTK